MARVLPHLAALALVLCAGAARMFWTGPGRGATALAARAARLDRVPMTVGDWRGRPLGDLDGRTVEMAELAGYVQRRYENGRGEAVTVLIVCGRPGPIAVHTPDICYGGLGYEPSGPKARLPVESGTTARPDEFWVLDLVRRGAALPEHLRILYAWTADGRWRVSESPRLDFAAESVLYKIYIVRERTESGTPPPEDPAAGFARQFLPELRKALFSGA